jgi:WD40 repeat protein
MFCIYNSVLRAFGEKDEGVVPLREKNFPGENVKGRFVTTIHTINSGLLKLCRLQPACKIFRGICGMKMPEFFLNRNEFNVRGGIEYGFMSTTSDASVALDYAIGGDQSVASTVMVADMGMIDRGAGLDWLSQYPDENEILLPPLTAIEMLEDSVVDADQLLHPHAVSNGEPQSQRVLQSTDIRCLRVRVNCNMHSHTLEKLLAVRKKEVNEVAKIVESELKNMGGPDISRRTSKLHALQQQIEETDAKRFNNNENFTEQIKKTLGLLPQIGDTLQKRPLTHSADAEGGKIRLFGMIACGDGIASCGWDGFVKVWRFNRHQNLSLQWQMKLGHASSCVACLQSTVDGHMKIVSGHFDSTVASIQIGEGGQDVQAKIASLHDKLQQGARAITKGGIVSSFDGSKPASKDFELVDTDRTLDVRPRQRSTSVDRITTSLHAHTIKKKKQKVLTSEDIQVGRCSGGSVTAIAALENLDLIATGARDGTIELWDVSGMLPLNLIIVDGNASSYGTAHHSTVSSLLWMKTGSQAGTSSLRPEVANIVLISGNFGGLVLAWQLEVDYSSGLRVVALQKLSVGQEHEGGVIALVEMSFRGSPAFASGSEDRSVNIWNVSTQRPRLSDTLHFPAGVCALAWLPNARSEASTNEWLAIGMGASARKYIDDYQIQIWNVEQKCLVKQLGGGHDKPLRSLVWLEDRGWLASASVNGAIRVWRVRTSESDQGKPAVRGTQSSLARVQSAPAAITPPVASRRPAKGNRVMLKPELDPEAGGCLVGRQVGTIIQDDGSKVPFQVRPGLNYRHASPRSILYGEPCE